MSEQPKTRQELYDRIRDRSKDEFVIEDMIRLGFWPAQREMPQDPAEEIHRRGEIQRELAALRTEKSRLRNKEAMLRELRKRRLEASREKQRETKARREREREERAAAWQVRKSREVLYLGAGVSAGLNHQQSDHAQLQQAGLPVLDTPLQLAAAMGIPLSELRFLAFTREVARVSHYVRFTLPKKTGGERRISAPMPRLKQAQYWILHHLLASLPVHDAVHGFQRGRSIVSNAVPHSAQAVVVNLDIQDFFPSVSDKRVKGLFQALGYSEALAVTLALLCTEPETEAVELDGERYFVASGERSLPQGAPTSPALTNLLCRRMDARLHGMAKKLGFVYTRYADDMTFSTSPAGTADIGAMLLWARRIVEAEGFQLHPAKTRVMHHGRRQEVTGVVVNNPLPAVSRRELRRFRALLYQLEKDGPEGKSWNGGGDVLRSAAGFADFVFMVDPEKGAELKKRVRQLQARYPDS